MEAFSSGLGSLIVLVLDGGVGWLEEESDSETVDSGSPLVVSTTEAMLRRKTCGPSAKRLDARRNAIVCVVCVCGGVERMATRRICCLVWMEKMQCAVSMMLVRRRVATANHAPLIRKSCSVLAPISPETSSASEISKSRLHNCILQPSWLNLSLPHLLARHCPTSYLQLTAASLCRRHYFREALLVCHVVWRKAALRKYR
jgi:hypothetical protein